MRSTAAKRAAMVSEVISYRGKSALRDVGKVFGLSLEQIDRLSAIVTHWDSADAAVPFTPPASGLRRERRAHPASF